MIKKLIKKNKLLFTVLHRIKNYKYLETEKQFASFSSNILGGHLLVKINNIPGEYEVDARSDIGKRILVTKEYEPEIVETILKNITPNTDAINIGANIGLYTCLIAQKISSDKKVLGLEPTSNAFGLLERNVTRNHHEERVIAFKGVAADTSGEFEINTIEGKEEYSSIGNLVHPAVQDKQKDKQLVKGETLDSLVNLHQLKPGLMVIDVEGAELKVLRGAEEVLKKYKPVIISELEDSLLSEQGSSAIEVVEFLEKLGYKVRDIKNNLPKYPFSGNIIAKI